MLSSSINNTKNIEKCCHIYNGWLTLSEEYRKFFSMSSISEVVDSLENRISKLLHRHEKLKQAKANLEQQIMDLRSQQEKSNSEIENLRAKCDSLKIANSMLGSDQHKRETKLKINALVREIDSCISQLSE